MPRQTACPLMLDGLFAGTSVATPAGWRAVEHLRAGDSVCGLDGAVSLTGIMSGAFMRLRQRPALWPVRVPAGALGNAEPLMLTPRQCVIVACASGPVLPAALLPPLRGIARVCPPEGATVFRLLFAGTERVIAGSGLALLCHGHSANASRALQGAGGVEAMALLMAREVGSALGRRDGDGP